jgi:type VI secretion system protein ImpE
MTAYELYTNGNVTGAIDAALRQVKSAPMDAGARLLACDLLCIDGQFDRADRQLDVLADQDSQLAPWVAVYRQLIRAAVCRDDVFRAGRAPEFFEGPTEELLLHARAVMALRDGATQEAGGLLGEAEARRSPVSGTCDGAHFADLRDVDDVTASFLEVLTTTGKYYWIEWNRIEHIEFQPPQLLRDMLWRPAEISFRGGPEARIYVPVLYADSDRSEHADVRLGRKTDWIETASGPTRGIGQRMLLIGDEARALLEIGVIAFSSGAANSSPVSEGDE